MLSCWYIILRFPDKSHSASQEAMQFFNNKNMIIHSKSMRKGGRTGRRLCYPKSALPIPFLQ